MKPWTRVWPGRLALFLLGIACLGGFLQNTKTALYRQKYGPPGAEHPYDFWAEGFLSVGLVGLGVAVLGTVPRPARRFRKAARRRFSGQKKPANAQRKPKRRVQ